jgi:poly(3-hydroxybutyrate) depolymerase
VTRRLALLLLIAAAGAFAPRPRAQAPAAAAGVTIDASIPPGATFDKADFRLWMPSGAGRIDAVVVLVPGSNGDARSEVGDAAWQAFAAAHHLALVGVHLTDKPHDQSFIEEYANVSKGSGQALLDALTDLARRAGHPEIANAPLCLWGMSAGGEFNYEFTAWKPERVAAFVVNKGGIYYTALASRAARSVPGLLFIGGKDLASRINIITGLFSLNRRGGALWALTDQPNDAHVVGRSKDLAIMFFEDVLALRLDPAAPGSLKPVAERSGFLGDLGTKAIAPVAPSGPIDTNAAWLPTERVAKAWRAVVTDTPFDR